MSDRTETHVDAESGLWIPPELREYDGQIVIRTPRATIQHIGSRSLDDYYGLVDASHFGDPDEMCEPMNPELAPEQVTIKRQGEEPVVLEVDVEAEIRADGGAPRAYVRFEEGDDWTTRAAWEVHSATGVELTYGDLDEVTV